MKTLAIAAVIASISTSTLACVVLPCTSAFPDEPTALATNQFDCNASFLRGMHWIQAMNHMIDSTSRLTAAEHVKMAAPYRRAWEAEFENFNAHGCKEAGVLK